MVNKKIQECFECLVGNSYLICKRLKLKELLDYSIDEIEKELKFSEHLKDISSLLNLKYSIDLEKRNIETKPIKLVVTTIIVTEMIKWQIIELDLKNVPLSGSLKLLGGVILCYYLVELLSKIEFFGVFRFEQRRKKKVIISLIDIEIEKRKKHQLETTSAEND